MNAKLIQNRNTEIPSAEEIKAKRFNGLGERYLNECVDRLASFITVWGSDLAKGKHITFVRPPITYRGYNFSMEEIWDDTRIKLKALLTEKGYTVADTTAHGGKAIEVWINA